MNPVEFDFCVRPIVVETDRKHQDVGALDKKGLRQIARGKIFVVFPKLREYVVIDSEVYDYLDQLRGVIEQIDGGNHETFAVSGDYFSNNLRFTFQPTTKKLEVYDVNGGDFSIKVAYKDFRSAFLSFYKRALGDLRAMYPELSENQEFCKMT
ncbi:MAG: hypothetical protein AAFP90_05790 [Planctomycetota bacterium]